MKFHALNLTLAFVFASAPMVGLAQDYKQGYVRDLMGSRGDSPVPPTHPRARRTKITEGIASESVSALSLGSESAEEVTAEIMPDGQLEQLTERPGVPVERIGAVLKALNPEELERNLSYLITTADKLDVLVGDVYFILRPGAPKKMKGMYIPLSLRGADIHYKGNIPEKYKISRSPSWIVSTTKGDVLLEGFKEIERFFNSKGEFMEPDKVAQKKESATPLSVENKIAVQVEKFKAELDSSPGVNPGVTSLIPSSSSYPHLPQ